VSQLSHRGIAEVAAAAADGAASFETPGIAIMAFSDVPRTTVPVAARHCWRPLETS
jgi:hypothetical protein